MTNLEAFTKSIVWRFSIAIPLSMAVIYYYTGNFVEALEMTIVANVLSTVLYYLFDINWFGRVSKYFGKSDVK
ncbi:hypothetical protein CMI47_01810 [Candidatus Pacearchaeota archaeon]|jgi:uncharacterized membrane protein|nr:hypothetical protein [Candidatus Pacearchaeota archaeon]|tara:strand:+ start:55 stop:273 length:219 start_codon:yes stop_codon:yes gene_type:complete